jgi:hypothetical protein
MFEWLLFLSGSDTISDTGTNVCPFNAPFLGPIHSTYTDLVSGTYSEGYSVPFLGTITGTNTDVVSSTYSEGYSVPFLGTITGTYTDLLSVTYPKGYNVPFLRTIPGTYTDLVGGTYSEGYNGTRIGTCIIFIGTSLVLGTSFGYVVTDTSSIGTWASAIFVGAAFDRWKVTL